MSLFYIFLPAIFSGLEVLDEFSSHAPAVAETDFNLRQPDITMLSDSFWTPNGKKNNKIVKRHGKAYILPRKLEEIGRR